MIDSTLLETLRDQVLLTFQNIEKQQYVAHEEDNVSPAPKLEIVDGERAILTAI